jgi:hypothetical protein
LAVLDPGIGNADPDPGAWKLTKMNNKTGFLPFRKWIRIGLALWIRIEKKSWIRIRFENNYGSTTFVKSFSCLYWGGGVLHYY